jgi:hypothetical protein
MARPAIDSIVAFARKMAIDSIIRATLPAGMAIPVWSETAHMGPTRPRAPSAIRRVAVIPPAASRSEELNVFARVLTDSLQRALAQREGYTVIDPDSVSAVVASSRNRSVVQRALNADLFITPSFVGAGEAMTVLVTIRSPSNPSMGRVASSKFDVRDPAPSIPGIVKLVGAQHDNLGNAWTVRFVTPSAPARGNN